MQLYEKYRPKAWDEVVGQDKAVKSLIERRDTRGLGGKAYFISGQSGTGKTTIARLIAKDVASQICTIEVDASDVDMAWTRQMERMSETYGFGGKSGRAFIINEAHGLSNAVTTRLLTALERIRNHVVWVFTTTADGLELFEDKTDASPLLSRCVEIKLARRDLAEPFARLLQSVGVKEGLNGRDLSEYIKVMRSCGNNLRRGFQKLENGELRA